MSLEPGQGYRLLLLPPTIADISILSVIKKEEEENPDGLRDLSYNNRGPRRALFISIPFFSPFFEHLEGEGVLYTCVQLFNSGCQDWEVDSHQHGEDAQVEPVRSAALHYSGHDIMPKKRKRWMVYFYMNNQAHDHYYFVIQSQNLFIFFWWGFSDILYPINHTPVARIITSETSHTVRWKEEAFSSSLPLIFFFSYAMSVESVRNCVSSTQRAADK